MSDSLHVALQGSIHHEMVPVLFGVSALRASLRLPKALPARILRARSHLQLHAPRRARLASGFRLLMRCVQGSQGIFSSILDLYWSM